MLTVGAGDVVVGTERAEAAYGHRLLADVEVAEAADLPQAVRLSRLFLEAADQQHLPEPAAVLLCSGWVESFWLWLGSGSGGLGHPALLGARLGACLATLGAGSPLASRGTQGDTPGLSPTITPRDPSRSLS